MPKQVPQRGKLAAFVVLSAGFALLLPCLAAATIRYVSPTGSSANNGTSPSTPWPLSKANTDMVAGDVCILLPGTYTTSINPSNAGTGPTSRISYVGSISNPSATVVPSIQPSKAYISIKGVKSNGSVTLAYPARNDSVAYCIATGLNFWAAKYCMVARNQINGGVYFLANGGNPCYSSQNLDPGCFANSEYDTLRRNAINLGNMGPGARSFEFKAWTQNCLIDSNQVRGIFNDPGSALADGGIAFVSYNSYYQTFRDNRWEFDATNNHHNYPGTTWDAFYLRDSLHTTTFTRDTILAGANTADAYNVRCTMSASGSFGGSVRNITMTNCIIRSKGDIYWQDTFKGWTLDNCVLASKSGIPLYIMAAWNGSKVRHSTIWSNGEALRIEGSSSGSRFTGTGNEITSNIFYSNNAGPLSNGGGLCHFKESTTGFTSNRNLFFAPTFTSTTGDRSLMWAGYYGSRPGSGQPWANMNGQDVNSKYGSPLFTDSSWTNLNPRLRTLSPAIGLGLGGTDAGAFPFSGGGSDVIAPSAVVNLGASQVADRSIILTWTATGDDLLVGAAASYDLRWSTSPITSANFASATPVSPPPATGVVGTPISYVLLNLNASTTYYFAIIARDEANNASPLSNVYSATTSALDLLAPASVPDLGATP